MANPLQEHSTNRLLAALPRGDLARLRPHLELVRWPAGLSLYHAGSAIKCAYFPISGMASSVAYMAGGGTAEVGLIGREGMLGMPLVLGSGVAARNIYVLLEGTAFKMKAAALREEFDRGGALHHILLRYVELALIDAAQLAACNLAHSVSERCARWLLRARDGVGRDEYRITHEFLSMMLGVRRQSVSVAARRLHKTGLIDYANGVLKVLDGRGLEAAACECYQFMRAETERLLPLHPHKSSAA